VLDHLRLKSTKGVVAERVFQNGLSGASDHQPSVARGANITVYCDDRS